MNFQNLEEFLDSFDDNKGEKIFFTSSFFIESLKNSIVALKDHGIGDIEIKVEYDNALNYSSKHINNKIFINAACNDMIYNCDTFEEKYVFVLGLFIKQVAEILFSDSMFFTSYLEKISLSRAWKEKYPEELLPSVAEVKKIAENANNLSKLITIYKFMFNCLEEGYAEHRFIQRYKGLFSNYLINIQTIQFESSYVVSRLNEMIYGDEINDPQISMADAIFYLMRQFARFQNINALHSSDYDTPLVSAFSTVADMINDYLATENSRNKMNLFNLMFFTLWEYIKDLILENDTPEDMKAGLENIGLDGNFNCNMEPQDNSHIQNKTEKDALDAFLSSSNFDLKKKKIFNEKQRPDSKFIEHTGKNTVSDESAGGIENEVIAGSSGDNSYVIAEIEKILQDIVQEQNKISECEAVKKLNQSIADSMEIPPAHSRVKFYIERVDSPSKRLVDNYNRLYEKILPISKRLCDKFNKFKPEEEETSKRERLYNGVYNRKRTMCFDDKIFCKKSLPVEKKSIAVALLVDESGSMSSGNKLPCAKATALVLDDCCNMLNIPIMICGHSSDQIGGSEVDVEIMCYTDFDHRDINDRYRLMDIGSRALNRDGAAIAFMGKKLSMRTEKVKILFIISDGKPNSSGYSGRIAEDDISSIKAQLNDSGIIVLAASIGSDYETIKRIYKDGFIDISNINNLPERFANILASYMQ